MFESILHAIASHDRVIIHRHSSPDGDALGSQIGLKHLIRANFPGKEVYAVGDEARRYAFMEDSVMDALPDSAWEGALAIILDCSARFLISDERYTLAAATARIDHHIFCEEIAQTEVTDTTFESCCGMIAQMAIECGWTLPAIAAQSLYTGMFTDSGRFRYDSTSARTHRLAAWLMEQDFDTNEIYRCLYASDFEQIRLRAQFTLKVQFTPRNVAYIYTTLEELRQTGSDTFAISRGMVGIMSDIRGVDIWVNFTETEQGVCCELRSSRFNINPIAVKYGGGGHAKASGATLHSREEAMAMLRDLDAMMEDNP